MADQEPKAPVGITFGKVIGSAAMAAGGVALGIATFSLMDFSGVSLPDTGTDSKIGEVISWIQDGKFGFTDIDPMRTAVFGGTVGIAGYGLKSVMEGKAEDAIQSQYEDKEMSGIRGGHVAREQ